MHPPFDIDKLHELETVNLCLARSASAASVADTLANLGFMAEDDFSFAPRPDQPAPWQAINIAEATFYSADAPVDFEQQCDRIQFACCFSALPPASTAEFVRLVAAAASLLGGVLRHRGQPTDGKQLSVTFAGYARDIFDELAEEPGSAFLARTLNEFRPTPGNA